MERSTFLNQIRGGLIVSCYAAEDYNVELSSPLCVSALATAVGAGGAAAIRTNLENVHAVKEVTSLPVIGIKKITCFGDDMRITPTLAEVSALVQAGADAVSIDGTKRPRLDDLSLSEFISQIKERFEVIVLADTSTAEEALAAAAAGVDGVGTTLAGYTPYSRRPGTLGGFPPAPPDYELIAELAEQCPVPVLAEGRFWTPDQAVKALGLGAHAVVVGTAITNPRKITERFVKTMKEQGA